MKTPSLTLGDGVRAREVWAWAMFDFANSGYTTVVITAVFNVYFVAVVTHQGPNANGMPELHKLSPYLGLLQDQGHSVALLTDGRMSGASGKVLAAIHVTPEASRGGEISKIADGDLITIDARIAASRAYPDGSAKQHWRRCTKPTTRASRSRWSCSTT